MAFINPDQIFASLSAADQHTSRGMKVVLDSFQNGGRPSVHYAKFVRPAAGVLAASRSPALQLDAYSTSSGYTTEADRSDDDEISPSTTLCYILSLSEEALPYERDFGYWFGVGDLIRFPDHAGVDLLLPPPDPGTSIRSHASIQARQGYFAFDPKYGQLWLHARHKGIRIGDRPLLPRERHLLEERTRISIGPYRYIFEFKVSNENDYQVAKTQYLSTYLSGFDPHEATSVTPSAGDVQIQDWRLHGVVGASSISIIYAATNVRCGKVVAVKRVRLGTGRQIADDEIQVYRDIKDSTQEHRYRRFIMAVHSVIQDERFAGFERSTGRRSQISAREAYLLLTPLAKGDFNQLGALGRWCTQPKALKIILFVQVLLGLSALHDSGWIHRDLKPANLGVVDLGDTPFAIILDEGHATRHVSGGHTPRIGRYGTIGFMAPELENDTVSATYDEKVDIWSMGAVAYFLFVGSIPWSRKCNMFLPENQTRDPSLRSFREAHAMLLSSQPDTMENLIGQMLIEDPRRRPSINRVLAHSAVTIARQDIERYLDDLKNRGKKRASLP